jgi:hypothetical protein
MGAIVDWINQFLEDLGLVLTTLFDRLNELPGQLDAITYAEDSAISMVFGQIHYVLGSPLFYLMSSLATILVGLALYKIAQTLINLIQKIIGNSKSKFILG